MEFDRNSWSIVAKDSEIALNSIPALTTSLLLLSEIQFGESDPTDFALSEHRSAYLLGRRTFSRANLKVTFHAR
jgi:hypothetical protein